MKKKKKFKLISLGACVDTKIWMLYWFYYILQFFFFLTTKWSWICYWYCILDTKNAFVFHSNQFIRILLPLLWQGVMQGSVQAMVRFGWVWLLSWDCVRWHHKSMYASILLSLICLLPCKAIFVKTNGFTNKLYKTRTHRELFCNFGLFPSVLK